MPALSSNAVCVVCAVSVAAGGGAAAGGAIFKNKLVSLNEDFLCIMCFITFVDGNCLYSKV